MTIYQLGRKIRPLSGTVSRQVLILSLTTDCTALVLPITEGENTLWASLQLTRTEEAEFAQITHGKQRTEWLACRTAMQQLTRQHGGTYSGLCKDEYGKPHLIGLPWHISLSHTSGWVAVALHRSQPVGIDIEPIREQFKRVVPRVLSDAEISHAGGDVSRLAVYWCAKEALYKLYGKRNLTFREHLHIDPFTDHPEDLTGHVRLPDYEARLTIKCRQIGPGLLAVAF